MAILEQCLLPCWTAVQVRSIWDSFYCGYRYFCTCFLQHLHKVFCCCSGIDLHFSHKSMLISRRQNVSPSWAVWWLRGPMVFILAHYCLYRWMWYLQAFGNCSQGWTRLHLQLTQMMSISLSEASKAMTLFSGIVQAVKGSQLSVCKLLIHWSCDTVK